MLFLRDSVPRRRSSSVEDRCPSRIESTTCIRSYDRYAVGIHHIAFAAGSRALVDERAAWLEDQEADIESGPREYDYTPGYYALFLHDPDGLKLELVHRPRERDLVRRARSALAPARPRRSVRQRRLAEAIPRAHAQAILIRPSFYNGPLALPPFSWAMLAEVRAAKCEEKDSTDNATT